MDGGDWNGYTSRVPRLGLKAGNVLVCCVVVMVMVLAAAAGSRSRENKARREGYYTERGSGQHLC